MNTATMTADTAPDTATAAQRRRPRMRGRTKALLILSGLVLMGLFRTGFMFIIIGMLPAIVAYYMDVSRRHYTFKTIFACNLAGMMPFIGQMLHHGPSSSIMQEIMGDAGHWVLIYGSALVGWLLVRITPMIALSIIGGFHNTQVVRLKGNQKRIENEWGKEVMQFSVKEEADDDDLFFR